jgi:short-subunit dehydrogenase
VPLPPPSDTGTALITGASSGIGEAIARELAGRGHGVTLVARRVERLRELAGEIAEAHGVRTEAVGADLGDAGGRDSLAARLEELGVTVEILVNNAGFGDSGKLSRTDRERVVSMVELNCVALLDLQARYSREMADRGRGAIINVASTAAFQPIPGTATYAATKAFVEVAGVGGAEERLPGVFWTEVEDVARAAVEGADRGKRVVVPGLMNRAGALSGQHSPRMFVLPLAKRLWHQGTSG